MRALRSLLFVPGNRSRMLEKARSVPADAVILDLEDAVPSEEKASAREMVGEALAEGTFEPCVIVRVNAVDTGLAEDDVARVLAGGAEAILLPKAQATREVEWLDSLLCVQEARLGIGSGSVALLLLVETALGVLSAYQLARTSARVRALCLGGEDLCRDLGATRTREGRELTHARGQIVLSARAAGVTAIDTVYTDFRDEEGLLLEARMDRQMGFGGKLLIHPGQIGPVHRAFAPTEEEVANARRVLQAYDAAVAQGEGVAALDGQMIDAPVVARARQVLAHLEEG